MSEAPERIRLKSGEEGLLSRSISMPAQINWQVAVFAALIVVAATMRFWDLGSRALHHDESLHVWTAWKLFQGEGYEHQAWMHGPFQFFGTAFTFLLFGVSDYTARVFPAIFGSALVALPFFLRRRLGTAGALLAAAGIAFSPTLLYFSRFARNDIYIAFFTLGIVISLWRYIDERKPLFLYLGAGLLALSFATKESTFLQVAVLLVFLSVWMAVHFWRQIWERNKPDVFIASLALAGALALWAGVLVGIALDASAFVAMAVAVGVLVAAPPVAIAALWPFTRRWRERIGLNDWHPAADFIIVLGTLSLPQFSAGLQVPLEGVFDITVDSPSAGHILGIATPLNLDKGASWIVLGLIAATAVVGLRWNWRVWAIAAAAFYVPYALLYTSFFTSPDGFASGIWGSVDYWLEQQDVRRGDQPWFYYLMLLPTYEFLALIIAAPALFYYAIKGDVFRRFLVFWAIAVFVAYTLAAEKMPWLSVNTTVPVILLAAVGLGHVLTSGAPQRATRWIEPYGRPLAAGALGLAVVALGVFGPASGPWMALRVLLMIAASFGILWLLLSVNPEQVAPPARGRQRRRAARPSEPVRLRQVAVVGSSVIVGGLLALTLFVGVRLTYQLGDVPRELLVYTQTSPRVPDVVGSIETAGVNSGLEQNLPVVIDGGIEPWMWYLRDYKQITFTHVGQRFEPPPGAVVLVLASDDAAIQPYADQYQEPARFPLRWWFPEFETYKTLPTDSLAEFAEEFVGSLFRASTWDNWWDYFRDRRPPNSPPVPEDALGRLEMVAYFPKEYQVQVPTVPPEQPPATETVPPPSLPELQKLPVGLVLGQFGTEPGAFNQPAGLTIDSAGNLYVTEVANHRVQKFDPEGNFVAQVGGKGESNGRFNEPWGVATDAEGNVYVADTFNHRIQKFDANLNFLLAWGKPATSLDNPEPDAFWGPRDVAVDGNGDIWITDGGTGRVVKYGPDGRFIEAFGGMGDAPGQFVEPVGIEITAEGDILVADSGNRRVQRFDAAFHFLAEYAIPGWLYVDAIVKPYIALLPDGGLIVSDPTQNVLFRLDADGVPVATLDAEDAPLVIPRGVAFDSRGYVYVAEAGLHQVRQLLVTDLAPE